MKKEVYEAKIFEMKVNPETKKNTICLEVELDDFDFNEVKEYWADNEIIDIRIQLG